MKKITMIVGLVIVVGMLSGCMMFDRSTDRSDRYDRDDSGYSSFGGHSHH